MKKKEIFLFLLSLPNSQTWGRFGMRGTPEGGATATGCSETIWRGLCAHTASHAGRSCSPSPFLVSSCCSQTCQRNFSGLYTAALCTMLLFPIKLYFLTGLTLLLLGGVGPCRNGGKGSWAPLLSQPSLKGPILPLLVPMGLMSDQQSQKVLYLL